MSVNKAIILGRVGQDPKIMDGRSGKFATFSVATTDRGYTKQDGTVIPERTEWHNIVVNGKLVQIVESFVKKGSMLYIEGQIRTRKYTDNSNIERSATEIHIGGMDSKMELLTPKPDNQQGYQQPQYPQQSNGYGRDPLQDFAAPPPTAGDIPGFNQPKQDDLPWQ